MTPTFKAIAVSMVLGIGAARAADAPKPKEPKPKTDPKPKADPYKDAKKPAPDTKPADPVEIKEEDLQRAEFKYSDGFSWKKNPPATVQAATPKPKDTPSAGADAAVPDMTSGELIIQAFGEFSREQKQVKNAAGVDEDKEVLTLTKNVEIEQLQVKFGLRAQRLKIVRDVKSGQTDLVEAQGNVEVTTPERSARGDALTYETRFGPHGEVLKDLYTIEGDHAKGTRATLYQGDTDKIQAEKFVSDRRLDTFRVLGNPVADLSMPTASAEKSGDTPKPAPSGGGMLPSLNMGGGGKIHLECDGEIFYEGSLGRVRVTRNVVMKMDTPTGQTSMKLSADEVVLTLSVQPGQSADNSSMFSGSLKSMDMSGRVEIKMPTNVLLFDKGHVDMIKNVLTMEMKEGKGDVRIFGKDAPGDDGGFVYLAPKSLTANMTSGEFSAGGPIRRELFSGEVPTNRPKAGKEGTPAKDPKAPEKHTKEPKK
jgi:lipopolysaccharide export system protein LptA